MSSRKAEATRKRRQKTNTRRFVQRLKERSYERRTGERLPHYLLHWHHRDPSEKYKKISQLYSRSIPRILEELKKCTAMPWWEHLGGHGHF